MNEIKARHSKRYSSLGWEAIEDKVVVESALEIQLVFGPTHQRKKENLAVTLRTPGQDTELAYGLLLAEGLIGRSDQIQRVEQLSQQQIRIHIDPRLPIDLSRLSRRLVATASCGLCGKEDLASLGAEPCYFAQARQPIIEPELLLALSDKLRQSQALFGQTGGIHAAGLFDTNGTLLHASEDVGRHNALDKLIGLSLIKGYLPLQQHLILLSGRIGYELVQKAAMAGLPILVAVGAPTDLAITTAQIHGMTLVGFLRPGRFNVYTGDKRIK